MPTPTTKRPRAPKLSPEARALAQAFDEAMTIPNLTHIDFGRSNGNHTGWETYLHRGFNCVLGHGSTPLEALNNAKDRLNAL